MAASASIRESRKYFEQDKSNKQINVETIDLGSEEESISKSRIKGSGKEDTKLSKTSFRPPSQQTASRRKMVSSTSRRNTVDKRYEVMIDNIRVIDSMSKTLFKSKVALP